MPGEIQSSLTLGYKNEAEAGKPTEGHFEAAHNRDSQLCIDQCAVAKEGRNNQVTTKLYFL